MEERLRDAMEMVHLTTNVWLSMAISVAAKLNIADLLATGPRSVVEMAAITETDESALYRLLRALASRGIFAEREDGLFESTSLGATLQSGGEGSLRGWADTLGDQQYRAWGELLYSLRTGQPAFKHIYAATPYEFLAQHPQAASVASEALTGTSELIFTAAIAAYDFGQFETIADIGGGQGALLTAILKAHPRVRGMLFEQPYMVESARQRIEANGLSQRCTVLGGDFFETIPAGADAYLLSRVILGWPDDQAIKILRVCHSAMRGRGKLLLLERFIEPGNEPSFAKWMDLNMLVIYGGRERTIGEFDTLLAAAGFQRTQVMRTQSPMGVHIIEARP